MRYLGAGIGHKATNKYTTVLQNDALAMVDATQSSTDPIVDFSVDDDESRLAEEQDYGYEMGTSESEDDEESDGDVDFGAEDGEEPWDVDDLHAEGYDEL